VFDTRRETAVVCPSTGAVMPANDPRERAVIVERLAAIGPSIYKQGERKKSKSGDSAGGAGG